MTTSQLPPPPGICRTCRVSLKGCDRSRDLRGRPCCHLCAHREPEPADLGPGSEEW